jgi:hypothetical protein
MTKNLFKETKAVRTTMKYEKGGISLSTETKENNIGTCAVLSALFLKNTISKAPEKIKPD